MPAKPKSSKRSVKFVRKGGLDRKKIFDNEVKKDIHSMMDADKRRIEREEKANMDEEREHMDTVRRLNEIDPEFKEYLGKNDPSFGEAMEEQLDMSDDDDENPQLEGDADDGVAEPTLDYDKCEADLTSIQGDETRSIKAMKRCISYFSCAAQRGFLGVGESSGEDSATVPLIKTTELFTLIVSEGAAGIPEALDAYLGRQKGGKLPHKTEAWEKFRSPVRVYLTAVAQLLMSQGLPDELAAHVLKNTVNFVEYGFTHTGAARALLKSCLHHVAQENEKVQLAAFMVVREMAKPGRLPPPFTDVCMKGMYLTFVKNTRSFSFETHNTVSFVMNECVDLFGVDLASAYQHIFMYVRQLAVYLKTALQSGAGEDAFRHVYNWQYVNSLRLWAMTVARYNDEKELYPLVCQIETVLACYQHTCSKNRGSVYPHMNIPNNNNNTGVPHCAGGLRSG